MIVEVIHKKITVILNSGKQLFLLRVISFENLRFGDDKKVSIIKKYSLSARTYHSEYNTNKYLITSHSSEPSSSNLGGAISFHNLYRSDPLID